MRPEHTKILLIQTAFIGDVVLCTPLIRALADRFTGAEIHVLVRKGNEGLLSGNPYVSRVYTRDKTQNKRFEFRRLLRVIHNENYDLLYNLQRFLFTGALTAFSKVNFRAGFNSNPFSRTFERRITHQVPQKSADGRVLHEVQRNLLLLGLASDKYLWTADDDQKQRPPRPELYPSEADRKFVKKYVDDGPFVIIAPASVWYTKQWPESKWSELMALIPPGLRIVLVGGPTDIDLGDRLYRAHPDRTLNLCGKLSFLQTAALMEKTKRVFTNDSAPLHFASSVNAPVTAIYCATAPEFGFGPLSDDSVVVRGSECCSKGIHGHSSCREGHFRCAMDIEPTLVVRTMTDNQTITQ